MDLTLRWLHDAGSLTGAEAAALAVLPPPSRALDKGVRTSLSDSKCRLDVGLTAPVAGSTV